MRVSDFLGHSFDERKFFGLLLQKEKAGTKELKSFIQAQIEDIRSRRQPIRERIQVSAELGLEHQARYYSAWWYAAIHVLVAFHDVNTLEDLATRLRLETKIVEEALEFLVSRGLVVHTAKGYKIGTTRIHLGSDSPLISRHHANWRLKAIEAQESRNQRSLHYSAVLGISKADAEKVRSSILDLLQSTEQIVNTSKEEAPFVFLVDFFGI